MSIYHFENNQLVKVGGELQELLDEHSGAYEVLFQRADWYEFDDLDGIYVLYVPSSELTADNILYGYSYALCIEDFANAFPWVVLIGNDPNEYLAAMKLVEPLFTKASFLRERH
ncbi:hypothetical protein EHLJMEHL_02206 [Vreelandella titanicae]